MLSLGLVRRSYLQKTKRKRIRWHRHGGLRPWLANPSAHFYRGHPRSRLQRTSSDVRADCSRRRPDATMTSRHRNTGRGEDGFGVPRKTSRANTYTLGTTQSGTTSTDRRIRTSSSRSPGSSQPMTRTTGPASTRSCLGYSSRSATADG